MSIAWGSLALLIVLLPGVLFYVGINWPEQFTREAEQRTPLEQLAGALLVAFLVHGLAYSILSGFCGTWLPCISVAALLNVVNVDPKQQDVVLATERMLQRFRWWILLYVLVTASAGLLLGAFYGWMISRRWLRRLSRHPWIYDLSVDGLTYAYVLTHVSHDDRILMYKGFLRAFGLQQDGRFSYIVLRDVTRLYMSLEKAAPLVTGAAGERVIGGTGGQSVSDPSERARHKRRVLSYFVIEGEDVANAVFDRLAVDAEALPPEAFQSLVNEQASQLGVTLTSEDQEALEERSHEGARRRRRLAVVLSALGRGRPK
jgi:hypothetical protein